VVEVGLLSESKEIFGTVDLKDGQTIYTPGLFTQAIQTPNAIIHLQEFNRPENDKTLNALFSILDPRQRQIWIDDLQKYIKVAPGVTFFASLNMGYQFIGTMPLDEALADRFQVKIHLTKLPKEFEINLLQMRGLTGINPQDIVEAVDKIRTNSQDGISISTRSLVELSEMVSFGIPLVEALQASINIEEENLESILQSQHFAGNATEYKSDVFTWYSTKETQQISSLIPQPLKTINAELRADELMSKYRTK
jgi:nitric oxide reductase NorQ protein